MIRWLSKLFGAAPSSSSNAPSPSSGLAGPIDGAVVNPATGLPMVGGIFGLDTGGNPYGYRGDRYDTSIPDEKIHDSIKWIVSHFSASASSSSASRLMLRHVLCQILPKLPAVVVIPMTI